MALSMFGFICDCIIQNCTKKVYPVNRKTLKFGRNVVQCHFNLYVLK